MAAEGAGDERRWPSHAEQRERVQLVCSVSGFDDAEERQRIIETIEQNGGVYSGDLTRKVTHLIVSRPRGEKIRAAAKKWDIPTVSPRWPTTASRRGMILDEKAYDPCLPDDEQGKERGTAKRSAGYPRQAAARRRGCSRRTEGQEEAEEDGQHEAQQPEGQSLGRPGKPAPKEPTSQAAPFEEAPTQPATGASLLERRSGQPSAASSSSLGD